MAKGIEKNPEGRSKTEDRWQNLLNVEGLVKKDEHRTSNIES